MKKVASVCIILLIVYNIVLNVQRIISPDEIPSFLGYKNFIILSGSMKDTLNIGDIIFIKEKDEIKENDIISFKVNDVVVTHRAIEIIEVDGINYYKTKGDANSSIDDELIEEDDIEGVYCFKIPFLGNIILFLQSKIGLILLLAGLGIVYLIINNVINIERKKGKHAQ